MGLLFCLMATGAFTAFFLLIDRSQQRGVDPWALNATTFGVGLLVSSAASFSSLNIEGVPPALFLVGSAIGIAAGLGMLGITFSVRSGLPIAIVNTAVSLSLAVPVLGSVILLNESITLQSVIGLVLAAGSIYLLQGDR